MTIKNKVVLLSIISVFILSVVLSGWCLSTTLAASAFVVSENNFDNTKIEDDLADLDLTAYPKDKKGEPSIIEGGFIEYCYTDNAFNQTNFGLYLYVYNPSQITFSTRTGANVINMAIGYNEKGVPNEYSNIPLKYLSKTSGEYENLFYKFKISDTSKIISNVTNQNKKYGYRRYDIAGIQLLEVGGDKTNAVDYGVSRTYKYSGYSKGYSEESKEESTLKFSGEKLETVELEVNHTYYRSQTSSLGVGYQNQLDTVYFSVPKRLIDDYGRLQRIKAEWYEYKTKDIVVTSNDDFYKAALPYIGVDISTDKNDFGQYEFNKDIGMGLGLEPGEYGGGLYMAQWGWNLGTGYLHSPTDILYYLFETNKIEDYDPYGDVTKSGGVSSNKLYDYILDYRKTYDNGTLPIKNGTISADLFENDIDDSRKIDNESGKIQQGYSYFDFDADVDLQVLKSWNSTKHSFWENWANYGFWSALSGGPDEETRTVAPIQILSKEDISGSDKEISERLLVNYSDVARIKTEYNNAVKVNSEDDEEKVLVLFRFATSDYYSRMVSIVEPNKGFLWSDKITDGQAYIAHESVFFDFDIIQLTFNKNGTYTVIPVVASPIDIVDDITSPVKVGDGCGDALFTILMIIALVIFIVLLAKIIGWFVKTFRKTKTTNSTNVTINMSDYLDKDKDDKKKK